MDKNLYQVMVRIHEARGLPGLASKSRYSDVLAVVQIGPTCGITRSTETKYQSLNAVWEATWFETVKLTDAEFEREKIVFEVIHRNDWMPNRLIGAYEFSFSNVHRQKGHQYYQEFVTLALPESPQQTQGFLKVSVYVLKAGEPTPVVDPKEEKEKLEGDKGAVLKDPTIARNPYVLNILIYKAADILATQNVGTICPFVTVRFDGKVSKTQTITNAVTPMWNRRIEIPYLQPLTSDAIEIQLWNHLTARPDVLIGQVTLNFFKLGLSDGGWGPRWLPLYSNQYYSKTVSTLGYLRDQLSGGTIAAETEYVGRLMMRMSVTLREDDSNPPRLMSYAANPPADPPGQDYGLHFLIYSAYEIPVEGGELMVELAWGNRREKSKWKMGKAGRFRWDQSLCNGRPFLLYAPQDVKQCQDIIINLYHRAGSTCRKISYERIPVKSLCPHSGYFYINGQAYEKREGDKWSPTWRELSHTLFDPKQQHIVAGFLSCSIGIGPKHLLPENIPFPTPGQLGKFVLRAYVHQAGNLPSADDSGTSSPSLVLRFGGKLVNFSQKEETLFPYWYEAREMAVSIEKDPQKMPSVVVMIYHQTFTQKVLLGRAEIPATHILSHPNKPYRYRLRYTVPPKTHDEVDEVERKITRLAPTAQSEDQSESFSGDLDLTDRSPYALISFELLPYSERREHPFKWDPAACASKDFITKLECVGLRHLHKSLNLEDLEYPEVEFLLPPLPAPRVFSTVTPVSKKSKSSSEGKDEDEENTTKSTEALIKRSTKSVKASRPVGPSAQALKSVVWDRVKIPQLNVRGYPLQIKLSNVGATKDGLGYAYVPLWDLLTPAGDEKALADVPPFYPYEEDETQETKKSPKPKSTKSKQQNTNGEGEEGEQRMDIKEDDVEAYLREEQRWALTLDPEEGVDVFNFLELYPESDGNEVFSGEKPVDEKVLAAEKERLEEEKAFGSSFVTPRNVPLWRGRAVGFQNSPLGLVDLEILGLDAKLAHIVTCFVKLFCHMRPLGDENRDALERAKLHDTNYLADIAELYQTRWVTRVYCYKAFNLAPTNKLMSAYHSTNPYLVIKNGEGSEHSFVNRVTGKTDDTDPEFYQHFEIPTSLPGNSLMEVAVWDANDFSADEFTGSCTLDIEDRILNKKFRGKQELFDLRIPNAIANICQGKLSLRVDILTLDQARREKAEELHPPIPDEYELRMVIWKTRGVQFPEDNNKRRAEQVDQKIRVTSNFGNKAGRDEVKNTDVAWYAAGGAADWNYRMKWRLHVPPRNPRLQIAMWDENWFFSSAELIGELIFSLQPFFKRCLKDKKPVQKLESKWYPFYRSDLDQKVGEVNLEFYLVTVAEADKSAVGEAQNEPNRDPFLPNPERNPPPWAVGSIWLTKLAQRRGLLVCICLAAIFLPLLVPLAIAVFKNNILSI